MRIKHAVNGYGSITSAREILVIVVDRDKVIIGELPEQTLAMGVSSELDLSKYFRDPDGDTIKYTVTVSDKSVVTMRVIGTRLTIIPKRTGRTKMTVWATARAGAQSQTWKQHAFVTVKQTTQPPASNLRVGDAIIVQNTLDIGLNIRGGAGTAWNIKGKAFDGATGSITDGPVSKNGYTWWKVQWNASNSVVWTNRPVSNQGWSVETLPEESVRLIVPMPKFPDLVVESPRVNKNTLVPGEHFTLSTTLRNSGTGRSTATRLRYYQSSDAYISTNDTQIGIMDLGALNSGGTWNKNFRITAPDVPGTYYYGACVNSVQGENHTSNNCSQAIAITVKAPSVPDLIVEPLSVSKTALAPGESFILTAKVRNQGTGEATPTWLRYHGPSGREVDKERLNILAANTVSERNIKLDAPEQVGTYHYDVCVDSLRGESNTYNNCATVTINVVAVPIQDRGPEPIQNSSPESVGQISNQTLQSKSSVARLDLSNYFRDADGDSLRYTTTLDNPNVVFLQVVSDSMNIRPLNAGTTNVTVRASDGSLTATQHFSVTVRDAPRQNQSPKTVGTIPTQTLTVGAAAAVQVSGYFSDSDGDSLTYTAHSDDANVATTFVSGPYLTLTPLHAGSAWVTVRASDGSSTATQRFTVEVGSGQTPQPTNQPPAAIGTIPQQTLKANGNAWRANVSSYFRDADGDSLTYTARSDNTNVATVRMSGAEVTITPQSAGTMTIHITASDGTSTASQSMSVTVVSTPPVQDPTSFDLALQSVRVSKSTVAPNESFTLSITIHNNGPAASGVFSLSYYYSLIQGRTPEDQIHREGTVQLDPLASGANTTKSFTLNAPSTPRTYYYGAWLSGMTDDTNLYNDVATEVGLTVRTVQAPDGPDLVVESARVSKDTLEPGDIFKFYATVRNRGDGQSNSTRLRYYRSTDANISKSDIEVDSDSVSALSSDRTNDESETLTAPNSAGIYYYGACIDSVTDESDTNNNCSAAIRITVQILSPDLVVESARVSDAALEPGDTFKFYATIRNQGAGEANRTILRYYRSTDSHISSSDTEVDTDSVISLDPNESGEEWDSLTAPNTPGTYYYGVCVDSVTDESNTSNNCSTAIRITVQGAQPPAGLGIGDSIFVQNASSGGLNGLIVRSGAGTGFPHIISVFNGATGTITDGPKQNNGYTWWKVRWNPSDKVFCDVNPCVGWVIEFFKGTRVITKPGLAAPILNAMIPTETTLLPNYPNPFNPETWMPYRLSEASDVTVHIYSVNGVLIRRLDLGHQAAGMYQSRSRAAYWNGCNAFGERVASGLYFYTLTAGNFTATRKMLIRK